MKEHTTKQLAYYEKRRILNTYYTMLNMFRGQTEIERLKNTKESHRGMVIAFSNECWLECFFDVQKKVWKYYKFNPNSLATEKKIEGELEDKEFKKLIKELYK